MSSQKCDAFDPLPPLPMTNTKPPGGVPLVDEVGQLLHLGRVDAGELRGDAVEELAGVQRGPEACGFSVRADRGEPETRGETPRASVYSGRECSIGGGGEGMPAVMRLPVAASDSIGDARVVSSGP
jgi:hypothetical protein